MHENWVLYFLLLGLGVILLLVFILNCITPPFTQILFFLGLGCIEDQRAVAIMASALFGLWVAVLGIPILFSMNRSK
jgi:hypothetical protein